MTPHTFAHFDIGVHTGSHPRLGRFIESSPIGVLIEDEERGVLVMVAPDAFVPLTSEQQEAYEHGCPLGYVAKIGTGGAA